MRKSRHTFWRIVWILGFPVGFYIVSLVIYHSLWTTGWLAENPSGLPTLFGLELGWYICGPMPLYWAAIVALALNGKLPGTHRIEPTPYLCHVCGYDLRGSHAENSDQPCPECGAHAPYYQRKKLPSDL